MPTTANEHLHLGYWVDIGKKKISIAKEICRLISLYISPSQNHKEFNTYLDNLESNLETVSFSNPFLTILMVTLTLNALVGILKTTVQPKVRN